MLEVDHVAPIASGGNNDIFNYVTSCFDCNRGKGKRKLSDKTEIQKQKQALNEINEKRQQLKMLIKWKEELSKLNNEALSYAEHQFGSMTGGALTQTGKDALLKWITKFGLESVLEAITVSCEKFNCAGVDDIRNKSAAFDYIPRVCTVIKKTNENPLLKDAYYIRAIIKNRMYCDQPKTLKALLSLLEDGVSKNELKDIASSSKNWTAFKKELLDEYGYEL